MNVFKLYLRQTLVSLAKSSILCVDFNYLNMHSILAVTTKQAGLGLVLIRCNILSLCYLYYITTSIYVIILCVFEAKTSGKIKIKKKTMFT